MDFALFFIAVIGVVLLFIALVEFENETVVQAQLDPTEKIRQIGEDARQEMDDACAGFLVTQEDILAKARAPSLSEQCMREMKNVQKE